MCNKENCATPDKVENSLGVSSRYCNDIRHQLPSHTPQLESAWCKARVACAKLGEKDNKEYKYSSCSFNKMGNVLIKVKLMRVRITMVALEKQ